MRAIILLQLVPTLTDLGLAVIIPSYFNRLLALLAVLCRFMYADI
jgi:hypothetical protein